jgi:hypothetical protein
VNSISLFRWAISRFRWAISERSEMSKCLPSLTWPRIRCFSQVIYVPPQCDRGVPLARDWRQDCLGRSNRQVTTQKVLWFDFFSWLTNLPVSNVQCREPLLQFFFFYIKCFVFSLHYVLMFRRTFWKHCKRVFVLREALTVCFYTLSVFFKLKICPLVASDHGHVSWPDLTDVYLIPFLYTHSGTVEIC